MADEAAQATTAEQATPTARARAALDRVTGGRGAWVLAGLAALALVGAGWAALTVATRASWSPVARGLLPEDAKAAVEALEAKKIPHELDGDGGVILVPEDRVPEARLELAVATLPSGRAVGFELFDKSDMGRSSFAERVNFRRALEGELARTIRALGPVLRARVHLVLPKRRVFQKDQAQPSASVVVTLRPGRALASHHVQAIRQLVAGAVERMEPTRVAVVDDKGDVLARGSGPGLDAQEALEKQTAFEATLEDRVVALLEPTLGEGRVRATVSATLDFSRVVRREDKYDPEGQVVRSEHELIEKRVGASKPAQGPPGTASNLPTRAPGRQAPVFSKPSQSDKSDSTKNYEIDHTFTQKETPHPRVERLSVAVVLDAVRDEDGKVKRRLTAEELGEYKKIVASAVGLDPQRGDTIEVASMPFAANPLELGDGEGEGRGPTLLDELLRWAPVAGIGLALLLGALALWLGHRRRRKREAEEAERRAQEELAARPPEPTLQERIAALRERARAQSERDVLVTASVLRRWLNAGAGAGTSAGGDAEDRAEAA